MQAVIITNNSPMEYEVAHHKIRLGVTTIHTKNPEFLAKYIEDLSFDGLSAIVSELNDHPAPTEQSTTEQQAAEQAAAEQAAAEQAAAEQAAAEQAAAQESKKASGKGATTKGE